jgi:hypothetical protein
MTVSALGREREPEVRDPDPIVVADQHVLGLEVAVDDTGRVRGSERPIAPGAPAPRRLERPGLTQFTHVQWTVIPRLFGPPPPPSKFMLPRFWQLVPPWQ